LCQVPLHYAQVLRQGTVLSTHFASSYCVHVYTCTCVFMHSFLFCAKCPCVMHSFCVKVLLSCVTWCSLFVSRCCCCVSCVPVLCTRFALRYSFRVPYVPVLCTRFVSRNCVWGGFCFVLSAPAFCTRFVSHIHICGCVCRCVRTHTPIVPNRILILKTIRLKATTHTAKCNARCNISAESLPHKNQAEGCNTHCNTHCNTRAAESNSHPQKNQAEGGYVGLFCGYVGLFDGYVGLFCGCTGPISRLCRALSHTHTHIHTRTHTHTRTHIHAAHHDTSAPL